MEEIDNERATSEETVGDRCCMILAFIGYLVYYGIPVVMKILLAWYYVPVFSLVFWVMSLVEAVMLLYASMEWSPNRKPKAYPTCTLEEFYNRQALCIAGLLWSVVGIFTALIPSKTYYDDTLALITIAIACIPLITVVFGAGTKFALRHSEANKRCYRVMTFWICLFTIFIPSVAESLIVWFFRDNAAVVECTILMSGIMLVLLIIYSTIHCMRQGWAATNEDQEVSCTIELKLILTGQYALVVELFWSMVQFTIAVFLWKYLSWPEIWLGIGPFILLMIGVPISFLIGWLICGTRRRSEYNHQVYRD
jgi:hypothetical protein